MRMQKHSTRFALILVSVCTSSKFTFWEGRGSICLITQDLRLCWNPLRQDRAVLCNPTTGEVQDVDVRGRLHYDENGWGYINVEGQSTWLIAEPRILKWDVAKSASGRMYFSDRETGNVAWAVAVEKRVA